MADDCSTCAGGSNLVFRLNPDADVVDLRRTENVVLIPQRLDPARVFIDELAGLLPIDNEMLTNGDAYVLRWSDTRTYDDDGEVLDGECGFDVTEPDDCAEVEWDPGVIQEPEVVDDLAPGAVAINTATGCITHMFCNGRWLCVAGSVTTVTGTDANEQVCYPDLSGQTYSAGSGEWLVFGIDQMTTFTCGDEQVTACPVGLEMSTDYGSYSGAGPSDGWNSLGWSSTLNDESVLDDCDTVIWADGGDPRTEFRVDFGVPSGSACPLILTATTDGDGSMGFAAYDTVSNTTLDPTIITAPPGTIVQSSPTGDVVRDTGGSGGGLTRIQFTCGPGVDPANVRIVFFGWGDSGDSTEEATGVTLEYTQSSAVGCFEWANINALATWLNNNDPTGDGWAVVNGEVCKTVGPGQGTAYGSLGGTDSTSTPEVTVI